MTAMSAWMATVTDQRDLASIRLALLPSPAVDGGGPVRCLCSGHAWIPEIDQDGHVRSRCGRCGIETIREEGS